MYMGEPSSGLLPTLPMAVQRPGERASPRPPRYFPWRNMFPSCYPVAMCVELVYEAAGWAETGRREGIALRLKCSKDPERRKMAEAWNLYPNGIDVVINNAGYILYGTFEELRSDIRPTEIVSSQELTINQAKRSRRHLQDKLSWSSQYH